MYQINVSLVYALADQQWLHEVRLARSSSARDLIEHSGFLSKIEDLQKIDIKQLEIGIYSTRVDLDYLLEEGDRVEIYRPLTADPKEVRRQLALLGKTMGAKT